MQPDGVAILHPNALRERRVIAFSTATSPAAISELWSEACRMLNAADADQLRAAGYECRLVQLTALDAHDCSPPRLIDDAISAVSAQLETDAFPAEGLTIEIALPRDSVALPEFRGDLWHNSGELELHFRLQSVETAHARYLVRTWDEIAALHEVKTRRAPSQRSLASPDRHTA